MRYRPVYLNLLRFKFPITAIASFLHRLSGIILFLLIPIFLKLLQNSLYSENSFEKYCKAINESFTIKFIVWGSLVALIYHLLAGIRHIMMDAGYGESKMIATISSYVLFISVTFFSIIIGLLLC